MPFIATNTTKTILVKPDGDPNSRIAIIGEAPGRDEVRSGKPFTGMAGTILEQCLHSAGLIRSNLYVTNVVKEHPKNNNIGPFYSDKTGLFTDLGRTYVETLKEELSSINANVFVPMGNCALSALCNRKSITKFRGYVFESTLLPGRKVLPTIHPAATLRGNYIARYFISHDLAKAKRESATPELKHPDRELVIPASFDEAMAEIDYYKAQSIVSFDIEVLHYEVSCISFSSDPNRATSIPFVSVWTPEQERLLCLAIAELLQDPKITKVGQNIMGFDIPFLARQNKIIVQGPLIDTMIGHHIVFPDFPKGLDFLASIYSNQPYWKDMVSFKNIKKEN